LDSFNPMFGLPVHTWVHGPCDNDLNIPACLFFIRGKVIWINVRNG